MTRIIIIGGGHAAGQLCASLAEAKFDGHITLVTEEPHLPYHRPPLSKTLVKDPAATLPELRGEAFYTGAGITLKLGTRATQIDREHKTVTVQDMDTGNTTTLAYDHLVLATGARARELPGAPLGTAGVFYLRTFADAAGLRDSLASAHSAVVLGGGFIGLELAATMRAMGKQVTVLEAAPRLLARAVSPAISAHLQTAHAASGIDIKLNQTVSQILIEQGRFKGVALQGQAQPLLADLLVVGIGSVPEATLALAAGLQCDNGVVVDATMCSADPSISAMGDCASFHYPLWQQRVRLESVQSANEQARTVAARLMGQPRPHASMPWFWSDQGEARLQITGLWRPEYREELRAGSKPGGFSVMHFEGEMLRAVESINAPVDHMAARRELQKTVA